MQPQRVGVQAREIVGRIQVDQTSDAIRMNGSEIAEFRASERMSDQDGASNLQ
jgi:hypothetical protein